MTGHAGSHQNTNLKDFAHNWTYIICINEAI